MATYKYNDFRWDLLPAYNLAFSIKNNTSPFSPNRAIEALFIKPLYLTIYFNFSNNVLPTRTAEAGFCPVISSRSTTTFGDQAFVLI